MNAVKLRRILVDEGKKFATWNDDGLLINACLDTVGGLIITVRNGANKPGRGQSLNISDAELREGIAQAKRRLDWHIQMGVTNE